MRESPCAELLRARHRAIATIAPDLVHDEARRGQGWGPPIQRAGLRGRSRSHDFVDGWNAPVRFSTHDRTSRSFAGKISSPACSEKIFITNLTGHVCRSINN